MKNITIVLFMSIVFVTNTFSQVGVGTTTPEATLDIRSSNQATPANNDGILIPKIDDFPATPPTLAQDGMMVFVTGSGTPTKGFYYWDQSIPDWVQVNQGGGVERIDDLLDGKSDNDGTNDGSSIFFGIGSGQNDNGVNRRNVGLGYSVMFNNTTGYNNIAIGHTSLYNNISGQSNTAVGSFALLNNNANLNTAVGANALQSNTTGNSNAAFGSGSLYNNIDGLYNTALGSSSLYNNTSGSNNVASGTAALFRNTTGVDNIAMGYGALLNNVSGFSNVAIGTSSLFNNTGNGNIGIGFSTLNQNTTASDNIAIGFAALQNNLTGTQNVAIGSQALINNTTGFFNSAYGRFTLESNTTGAGNVAMGHATLRENDTGNDNIAIGGSAGNGVNGSNNVFLGHLAGSNGTANTNSGNVLIGYQAGRDSVLNNRLYIENSNSTTPLLYGEFDNGLLRTNGVMEIIDTNDTHERGLFVDKTYTGNASSSGAYISHENQGTGTTFRITAGLRIFTSNRFSNTGEVRGINNIVTLFANSSTGAVGARNEANANITNPSAFTIGTASHADNNNGALAYGSFASASGGFGVVTYAGYFSGDVYTTGIYLSSAKKLKQNITPLSTSLEKIKAIQVNQYNYNTDKYWFMNLPEGTQTGFIAEEFATVYPELVKRTIQPASTTSDEGYGAEKEHDKVEFTAVNYTGLIPHLVKAIQEQQQTITSQKETIQNLEERLKRLETLLLNGESSGN